MIGVRRKFFAAFLLAIWLVATQHCGLEAAGVFDSHCDPAAPACVSGPTEHCVGDGCEVVESGSYRIDAADVQVAAPEFTTFLGLLCLNIAAPDPAVSAGSPTADAFERPLGWMPTRHFARRAASLPGAPAPVFA